MTEATHITEQFSGVPPGRCISHSLGRENAMMADTNVVRFPSRQTSEQSRPRKRKTSEPASTGGDQIFGLIEAHRLAFEQWEAAVHYEFGIEGKVAHSRFLAAQQATASLGHVKDDLLEKLLSTQPTTIVGLIALAEYYCDITLLCDGSELPEALEDEDGVEKPCLFHAGRNIAQSLRAIAAKMVVQ
jgi:hypothetical protein